MSDCWKIVVRGVRSPYAFTYIGYGEHQDAIEGAIRTFFLLFPQAVKDGYRVYMLEGDNVKFLFEEKARNARMLLKMFQHGEL